MGFYIVNNKPDDYNNCKVELVETSAANAKEYYNHNKVAEEDVPVLAKYFWVVDKKEEQERTRDERFYGSD